MAKKRKEILFCDYYDEVFVMPKTEMLMAEFDIKEFI